MKLQLSKALVSLLALGTSLLQCEAFVPSRHLMTSSRVAPSSSATQLQQMILILEDDDGDENDSNGNNKNDNSGSRRKEVDLAQLAEKLGGNLDGLHEFTLIIQGSMDGDEFEKMNQNPQRRSDSLVSQWKEQLQNSSPPPLTTMKRVRMEKEIALLEQLATSDDALKQLVELWIAERGSDVVKVLEVAAGLVNRGHPLLWAQAETMLIEMIDREGVNFVAPLQLLATLYGMQGRTQDCKDLNEMVLMQKPWHVGALAGAFNACKSLDDYKGLVKYNQDQMPSLREDPSARAQWAQRMASKAREALINAERGLQSHFDSNYSTFGSDGSIVLEDEFGADAWQ